MLAACANIMFSLHLDQVVCAVLLSAVLCLLAAQWKRPAPFALVKPARGGHGAEFASPRLVAGVGQLAVYPERHRKEDSSFLKKRSKRLLLFWSRS